MFHFRRVPMTSPVLFIFACLVLRTTCLSDSICVSTGATWVSDSPRLSGQFPYYNMLFFCQGDLNLESRNVDACIQHGASCGQPAADMFCQYMGFEGGAPDMFRTKTAEGPARSMTGEWCIQDGKYEDLGYLNRTQLEDVTNKINGTPCQRLDSVVCFNSRKRLAQNNRQLHPIARPPTESEGEDVGSSIPPQPALNLPPSTAVGGRRLLR